MLGLIEKISFIKGLIALSAIWVIIIVFIEMDKSVDVPDFQSMESVSEKKDAFFSYFGALAEEENQRILGVRETLQSEPSQKTLESLAKKYRVEIGSPATEQDVAALLSRVDIVPKSLVLAQAAIESAWGTSRFAREGYNYFGQWCFTKGCGLVPLSRNEGAAHEVREFDSPKESVQAYILNLNSHPTYETVRALRLEARNSNKPIHGCVLAAGLGSYSERGQHYIDEIRQMIRVNDLTPNGKGPCAAKPAPAPAEEDGTSEQEASQEPGATETA